MAIPVQIPARRNWFHDMGDIYDEQFVRKTHPTVRSWPLVERDAICFSIIITYFLFVNYLGPALMRGRKPFDLRWMMVPYNAFLVVANFYIFYEYAKIRWSGGSEIQCDTVYTTLDPKSDPQKYRLAEITWYYYITKYIELIDTVFFVLRKKDRQLSRLHIIHHTTVPLIVLLMLRSEPAMGDDVTIHLKFKRYVTMTQMIQFILVMYYFVSRPFYGCKWHPFLGGFNIFLSGFFLVLFTNFYWNEYILRQQELKLQQNGVNGVHQAFGDQEGIMKQNGVKKRAACKRIL